MAQSIIIESVGAAHPRMAVAVAHGLGLPIDRTLKAIYRAPARLVESLRDQDAERLSQMLTDVGLVTSVVDDEADLPEVELFDVAICLRDPAVLEACLDALARFCACDEARALELVTSPPGIVLGGVSQSTVDALGHVLPADGIELIASSNAAARYVVFPVTDSEALASSINSAIDVEFESGQDQDALPGLSYEASQRIWARFGRTGSVRIVNRDFLRFDIWLAGPSANDVLPDPSILGKLAGVPEQHWQPVIDAAPVFLERGVSYDQLAARLPQYLEAGLAVQGELVTFKRATVSASGQQREMLNGILARFGFDPARGASWLSPAMPLAKAQLLNAMLSNSGIASKLAEVQDA